MKCYDVFNGDADGIISLVQLRLAEPRDAKLVTGRKRDIKLLSRLDVKQGDQVTVLDISMRSNMDDLNRILAANASVFYVDHHNAGDIPNHPNLISVIDTSPEMCTAMLINEALDGEYLSWAVTATFGDNFPALAKRKAEGHDLPLEKLARLGMRHLKRQWLFWTQSQRSMSGLIKVMKTTSPKPSRLKRLIKQTKELSLRYQMRLALAVYPVCSVISTRKKTRTALMRY